jgi:hypothetical protein
MVPRTPDLWTVAPPVVVVGGGQGEALRSLAEGGGVPCRCCNLQVEGCDTGQVHQSAAHSSRAVRLEEEGGAGAPPGKGAAAVRWTANRRELRVHDGSGMGVQLNGRGDPNRTV